MAYAPYYYGYTLNLNGRIVYIGQTRSPRLRAFQHRKKGKLGQMRVERRFDNRTAAKQWERNRLARYRRSNGGRNPKYNKTWDG